MATARPNCHVWLRASSMRCLLIAGIVLTATSGFAGDVVLRNGFTMTGALYECQGLTNRSIQQSSSGGKPFQAIDAHTKIYFVSKHRVLSAQQSNELGRYDTFEFDQPRRGGNLELTTIGIVRGEPFNERGRRNVRMMTHLGEMQATLGITSLHPHYADVRTISSPDRNFIWEYSIATTSLEKDVLQAMLRRGANQDVLQERLGVFRFYIDANRLSLAQEELSDIRRDFPELDDRLVERLDEAEVELDERFARQILSDLQMRKQAGQHELAVSSARKFPLDELSSRIGRQVRELLEDDADRRDQIDLALSLIGDLAAEVDDDALRDRITRARLGIRDRLDLESIDRMSAFLNNSGDPNLTARDKLALAFSGWMMGSARATTDLEKSLNLWDARYLIGEFLRTDSEADRVSLLKQIRRTEGIGTSTIADMIPYLPPTVETPGLFVGHPMRIEVAARNSDTEPVAYWVVLPREYTPTHRYPMVITLRRQGLTHEQQLEWWCGTSQKPGQSQRHGYIVVSPEYASDGIREYDFDVERHSIVLAALRDARKRFSVDSDRIFLSGHGMGGDAAIDIGMSHTSDFAGVIPITARAGELAKWYWQNAFYIPWYVVTGGRDRDTLDRNGDIFNRLMRSSSLRYSKKRGDVVFIEYKARGFESYYEEIHNIFDWMSRQKRIRFPTHLYGKVMRKVDTRFPWLEVDIPDEQIARALAGGQPQKVEAHVTRGNTIHIGTVGETHTLWLSPELIDFERRLKVYKRGSSYKHNDFVIPNIEDMLEYLREEGDRQRIVHARLVIGRRTR